jgi:hypothetical protein
MIAGTVTVKMRKGARAEMLRTLAERMARDLGRPSTDAELARMLAISPARVAAIRGDGLRPIGDVVRPIAARCGVDLEGGTDDAAR